MVSLATPPSRRRLLPWWPSSFTSSTSSPPCHRRAPPRSNQLREAERRESLACGGGEGRGGVGGLPLPPESEQSGTGGRVFLDEIDPAQASNYEMRFLRETAMRHKKEKGMQQISTCRRKYDPSQKKIPNTSPPCRNRARNYTQRAK